MYETPHHAKRYRKTLSFLRLHIPKGSSILDLGVNNPLSELMQQQGYNVKNTAGENLDEDQSALIKSKAEVVTAFEIMEHLLSPYQVLKSIKSEKLVISVPLRLWFSSSYRSKKDLWDRHFHEFEDWQLDWLLEKTGWKIVVREKWTNPNLGFGVRTILRYFTPRYYIVLAEKNKLEN
ncbi:MAG: methyltransferase [Flavobacteriaceae bacterium TMED121]|nr:MAG: methyltransferase [Flavobacteriaceae bacterium TMED121]|tara:strand:- start:8317 stop:8850 length:534 start_codon:yes stop_codon:yes gene_type:complete